MATLSLHSHTFFLLSLLLVIFSLRQHLAVAGGCQYPPVIFNFGDSNSDTGGLAAGLGYTIGLPNGRSFFRRSTGRLSDGRLIIDFLCFEKPLMACCGYGGPPYNYNVNLTCGHGGSNSCDEGSRFISWDGIHYTETANAIVAMKVLSMQYSTPPTPFRFFCSR
ncbi:hypothetical protein F2Q68_00013103 [Brassica cretica]|uniref:Uncharacterized protein n=1 Tax=Brassica cretica TaxID=69181 RepID=A0A8S9H9M9_BRACR|nr:hypothetical protein F2Q68_00013103 [Brassica cretica]